MAKLKSCLSILKKFILTGSRIYEISVFLGKFGMDIEFQYGITNQYVYQKLEKKIKLANVWK